MYYYAVCMEKLIISTVVISFAYKNYLIVIYDEIMNLICDVTPWRKNYTAYVIVIPRNNGIIIFTILFAPHKSTLSFLSYITCTYFQDGFRAIPIGCKLAGSNDGRPRLRRKKTTSVVGKRRCEISRGGKSDLSSKVSRENSFPLGRWDA